MRTTRTHGVFLFGTEAQLVTVEARFEQAEKERTEVVFSGLPDTVIRESRSRLTAALDANRLGLRGGRLFLNLAPAGVKKSGEALDLALALAAAAAVGHFPARGLARTLFLGELGIDGTLHDVPGGLAAAEAAHRAGLTRIVAPPRTAREAALRPELAVYPARHLAEVVQFVAGGGGLEALPPENDDEGTGATGKRAQARLDAIRGQGVGKHALTVAAAGGHALLFLGPPGSGKSLLARALPGLLPTPTWEERLELTRVHAASQRVQGGAVRERPFRAPHHTTSHAGLVGGGSPPMAGEITLAHQGVLFLDELGEFRRSALEALRQPLEEGRVHIARAARHVEFPAAFQLVAAMNPCPCGYRGHPTVTCPCSPPEIRRYRRRISGPLLDRIDLRLELAVPHVHELARAPSEAERACVLVPRILRARARAAQRWPEGSNARLGSDELDRFVPLTGALQRFVERAAERHALSARAVQSLRRVARTLADLEDESDVHERHLTEALALRSGWDEHVLRAG